MSNREQNRRENDALQSGEGNPAYGQDAGDFGADGQVATQPLSEDDAPDRDVERDRTLDAAHQSASSAKPGARETDSRD